MRRAIALGVHILFPAAARLTEQQWLSLLDRLSHYFIPRVGALARVLPQHSLENHGIAKLLKVAFGTLIGRTATRGLHETDDVDFIVNTLRLAYSWGATYPLVDNVLDSGLTPVAERKELISSLESLFADTVNSVDNQRLAAKSGSVMEIQGRLAEVLSLVPLDKLPSARTSLRYLLLLHKRDSARRLSAIREASPDLYNEVMIETIMKSALVRLATMEVCGLDVAGDGAVDCASRALFNQLGDDLWDIYEDVDSDRVTPFTLFVVYGGSISPFDLYYECTLRMTRGFSRRRQVAALMGYCETLRDALITVRQRGCDPLGVSRFIAQSLDRAVGESMAMLVDDMPHVDFDAVLFGLEKCALALLKR